MAGTLIEAALQISGWVNIPLAIAIATIGVSLAWWSFAARPAIETHLPRWVRDAVLLVIIAIGSWLSGFSWHHGVVTSTPEGNAGTRSKIQRSGRHLSHDGAERLMDALAPYGAAERKGIATLVSCQTVEAVELKREFFDAFTNIHWNVNNIPADAIAYGPPRFDHDGSVHIQGTFPEDLAAAFNRALEDSDLIGHVRPTALGVPPNLGVTIMCNE